MSGNRLMASSAPSQFIAVCHQASPHLSVYPWGPGGFGTKFANPSVPPGSANRLTFSPSGKVIVVCSGLGVGIDAYRWTAAGFGTKFSDPVSSTGNSVFSLAFSPLENAIAFGVLNNSSGSCVEVWAWSGSGFGAKFSNPATIPTGLSLDVAFTQSGNALAVCHNATPFLSVYPWSGAGFGTRYASLATPASAQGSSVKFSPAGDAIAVHVDFSTDPKYVVAYRWSGSGFGTKYTAPVAAAGSAGINGGGMAFSPSGDALAISHSGASGAILSAYPWSGASGYGAKYASPAIPAGVGEARDVAFSRKGDAIALSISASPHVAAYAWSASGVGTQFANPVTLPGSNSVGVSFGEIK